jgi:putative endonuclease
MSKSSQWYVYLLRCSDQSLYCGVTTDLIRRVKEHNTSSKGAKYTRVRRPVALAYSETALDRSAACKSEAAIKKLSKAKKEVMTATYGALK